MTTTTAIITITTQTADLVVEAVVENMELKQKLFAEFDDKAPAKTIFASNTSSLPIAEIASSTLRLDRCSTSTSIYSSTSTSIYSSTSTSPTPHLGSAVSTSSTLCR